MRTTCTTSLVLTVSLLLCAGATACGGDETAGPPRITADETWTTDPVDTAPPTTAEPDHSGLGGLDEVTTTLVAPTTAAPTTAPPTTVRPTTTTAAPPTRAEAGRFYERTNKADRQATKALFERLAGDKDDVPSRLMPRFCARRAEIEQTWHDTIEAYDFPDGVQHAVDDELTYTRVVIRLYEKCSRTEGTRDALRGVLDDIDAAWDDVNTAGKRVDRALGLD